MWRKEDGNPQSSPNISTGSGNATTPAGTLPGAPRDAFGGSVNLSKSAAACVSQGIKIKGELTGSEDLFIDGIVEGKITLVNSTLTVGPNATVKAEVNSKELVVRGRVEGKLTGADRIQVWHTARINGDLKSQRIAIEEGAEIHGKVEIGSQPAGAASSATSKKTDGHKDKETGSGNEKSSSGAAVAGAS